MRFNIPKETVNYELRKKGLELKSKRIRKGIMQKDLAASLNVTPGTLNKAESGERSYSMIFYICWELMLRD